MVMISKRVVLLSGVALLMQDCGAWAAGQISAAHAGTRKGSVYEATPASDAPAAPTIGNGAGAAAGSAAARIDSGSGGSAPVEPGAGVEFISGGGGGSDGAAKVGHLPVLQ